jgi:hypothetical protein
MKTGFTTETQSTQRFYESVFKKVFSVVSVTLW